VTLNLGFRKETIDDSKKNLSIGKVNLIKTFQQTYQLGYSY